MKKRIGKIRSLQISLRNLGTNNFFLNQAYGSRF